MTTVGDQHRQARKEKTMQHRRRLQIFQAAKRAAFTQQHQPEMIKSKYSLHDAKNIHVNHPATV